MSGAAGWEDLPPSKSPFADIADWGSRLAGPAVLQPRKFTLAGNVVGTSISDARSKLDRMKFELSKANITLEFDDKPNLYVNCRADDALVQFSGPIVIAKSLPI